ncbi:thiamine-phosphate kinase [Brunnivagina elsteri]|uniref:Thiamine-monophosphate kinase n=1 Tax=Brunnivagina elsteri CCALA 953 TaxID=987040 RepID=A0A2A2TLY6_9CYAN|nr:thiamine-phosphate kinase [Calothrix elsteri]PAX59562.1 thiamine-phosphate kinase [Calothrix elsteri CCALA 953]
MKVSDIGEQGLLKILQRFCPSEIIGDDGAVLNVDRDRNLVVTTDVLVDNIHFSEITTSPEDAGWRAVAANLSDIAAMGASPLGITVGLALPIDTQVDWVERLYQGMSECLQKYNTPIVGGDLVRSHITTISITAFGQVYPNRCIRRHTAKIGDAIVVTGIHGASRAGLELLLNPELGETINEADKQALILAHQRPQPRLDVLPILWDVSPDSEFTVSGMDSSDGLADAVLQICRASNVGAVLELQKLEWQKILVSEALKNWLTPTQILEYTLYGGEDFELVLCLPSELAEIFVKKIGDNAAIIGKITSNPQVILRDQINKNPDQVLTLNQGFQHFNNS